MATLLTEVSLFVTAAIGYVGEVATFIVGNPLGQLGIAMLVLGFSAGVLQRFIRVR